MIEPIFEANLCRCLLWISSKKRCKAGNGKVKKSLYKNWYVVDADIQGYFDNINHEILLSLLKGRISDRRILKLCRLWIQAGVIENGKYSKTEIGSSQGGVISPLLAKIYLHVLDSYWNNHEGLGEIVRYADDCIIMVGSEMPAKRVMRNLTRFIEEKLGLKVNMTKSEVRD